MKRIKIISRMAVITLAIASCNFPLFSGGETEADALQTAVAQTIEAMPTQALPTQPPEQPIPTSLPTLTPAPASTLPAASTAVPQSCNKAVFVAETVPDNTPFNPGESFTKSWTFRNTGTCTWNTNYKLAFTGGEAMGAATISMPMAVAPDAQIKLEVPMKAPAAAGSYTGSWALTGDDGKGFFPVTVVIKVNPITFAVTSLYTNLVNASPAACPYTAGIDITIQTNAAGKVTYQTETSEGATSPLKTIQFDAAGSKVAELDWGNLGIAGATTDYWLKVYIGEPNNQWFGPFNFSVTCP